jgi:restriction system protein
VNSRININNRTKEFSMPNTWFVRAGRDNKFAEHFLQYKIVAGGWVELGEVDPDISKAELLQLYRQVHPDRPLQSAHVVASQIIRYLRELEVGDAVMTYNREEQVYYLGEITSECFYTREYIDKLPRIRNVNWKYVIPRGVLSEDATKSLGTRQTVSLLRPTVAAEINAKARALQ